MRTEKFITRDMLRREPDTLFVFGDNLLRLGYGGQAKEMRGEPNAVGIPTKYAPGTQDDDYFTDKDLPLASKQILEAFNQLQAHALKGGEIVWPADGIGTGLAQLKQRAPKIWDLIEQHRIALTKLYPDRVV